MKIPAPFLYPATPHQRRHGPTGYKNYQEYKPWLRDEFMFRCVYCLERESWYPNRAAAFSVDLEVHQIFLEAFGFPEDLPDLVTLRPPDGNMRPKGKDDCYFRLRQRNLLPIVY